MARESNKLTVKLVESLSEKGNYPDGLGLLLKVNSKDSKSWVFRYISPASGKRRMMGLGKYPDLNLADARVKRDKQRKLVELAKDPIATRDAEKSARKQMRTFRQCAEDLIEENTYNEATGEGWKNKKHVQQWKNTLRDYVYPHIGNMDVDQIAIVHISQCLKPIWLAKHETATRVRQRIEATLDYAMAEGLIATNVGKYEGTIRRRFKPRNKLKIKKSKHPSLPYQELPTFWTELDCEESVATPALQLTILCATRTSETLKARWDEFDLENGVWTLPAERMKAGEEHVVPLSKPALEIVERMPRLGEFVFPSPRNNNTPLSQMSMSMLLRSMKRTDITVHGMRRTFRNFIGACTSYPERLAEMCLAHRLTDQAQAAYDDDLRIERRLELMEAWSSYCVSELKEDNVSQLRGVANG